jgi:hypothetical protein
MLEFVIGVAVVIGILVYLGYKGTLSDAWEKLKDKFDS